MYGLDHLRKKKVRKFRGVVTESPRKEPIFQRLLPKGVTSHRKLANAYLQQVGIWHAMAVHTGRLAIKSKFTHVQYTRNESLRLA